MSTPPKTESPAFARAAAGSLDGRRLTLAQLLAIFAVNFMDRQIAAILSEPIKRSHADPSSVRDAGLVGQGGSS
jgi:hypothetical protein